MIVEISCHLGWGPTSLPCALLLQILIQYEICHCSQDSWFEVHVKTFFRLDRFGLEKIHMSTMDLSAVELPEEDAGLSIAALQGLDCHESWLKIQKVPQIFNLKILEPLDSEFAT